MSVTAILSIAAVVLLIACGVSLWRGETVGLYGVIEPRTSLFYWIIVLTYGGLGAMCLGFAVYSLRY